MIKFFENFEPSSSETIDESLLTIEDGMMTVWHYSDVNITDGFVSPGMPQRMHSTGEYKSWGKNRAFFYCTKNGYIYDNIGGGHKYVYVCKIPVSEIYDLNSKTSGYVHEPGTDVLDGKYEFSREKGYTAWIYNLAKDNKVPIVVSFVDVEISDSYRFNEGGKMVDKDVMVDDYKIGEVTFKRIGERKFKKWDVYQYGEKLKSITNTYLKRGLETDKNFGSSTYLHKRVKLLPEFEDDY